MEREIWLLRNDFLFSTYKVFTYLAAKNAVNLSASNSVTSHLPDEIYLLECSVSFMHCSNHSGALIFLSTSIYKALISLPNNAKPSPTDFDEPCNLNCAKRASDKITFSIPYLHRKRNHNSSSKTYRRLSFTPPKSFTTLVR